MAFKFGTQTVIFETVGVTGGPDGMGAETETLVDVSVAGCRHRPLSAEETPQDLTDVATQIWKTTAPPDAAVLSAKSTGRLKVGGVTYQIVGGPKPFADMDAAGVFKVTVLSKLQVG